MAQPQNNPYLPPDIQLQQINLQRQQALADALKQQSLESTPSEVVSGRVVPKGLLGAIAPLLRAGLAVKTQDNVNQGTAKVAQAYNDYLTNSANSMFPGSADGGQGMSQGISQGSAESMPQSSQPSAQPQVSAAAPVASSGVQLPPQLKTAYINALRMGNTEGANKLLEMGWQAQMPTDMTKMAAAAGVDTAAANRGALLKNNYIAPIDARPGNFVLDPITKQPIFNAPNAQGIQYTPGPNGTFTAANVPGSLPALQNVATAENMGKAAATPYSGVDANGNPLPVTSVANVLSPSGPPATNPQDQAAIAAFNQAGRPNGAATPWQYDPSNPSAQAPVSAGPRVYAAPPMGATEYAGSQAKAAGERVNNLRTQAADSPMRINVLDNMLALSNKGTQTGPGSEWQANIKGLVANTPGFRDTSIAKNWQGNVSDYQEFSKFAMQNASRAWQAAGGTGSDAQLDAAIKGNISNKLFPQAVQQIATWAKGGELALQGKANAMDNWAKTHGDSPQSQNQFENVWRNAIDPQVYMLRAMTPQQATAYSANLQKTDPEKYKQLVIKSQQLKAINGL